MNSNPKTKADFINLLDLAIQLGKELNSQLDAMGVVLKCAHSSKEQIKLERKNHE